MAFRSHLAGSPKPGAKPTGKRGPKRETAAPRAASAVNVEIRSIKVVLGYLRSVGLLPKLSRDDLTGGLAGPRGRARRSPVPSASPNRGAPTGSLCPRRRDLQVNARRARGVGEKGATPRCDVVEPLIVAALLSGMRFGELIGLDWSEVDLEAREIHLSSRPKTKRARTISLEVSPALAQLLADQAHEGDRTGLVWALTADQVKAASRRLDRYGAPASWSWQTLRRTCGTYLTNAPGIFGAASAYRSACQLGHSVTIAERHYLGVVKVPKEATTLEAAMGRECGP